MAGKPAAQRRRRLPTTPITKMQPSSNGRTAKTLIWLNTSHLSYMLRKRLHEAVCRSPGQAWTKTSRVPLAI
jgi:hypothetical protein